MLTATLVTHAKELQQILGLQQLNLAEYMDDAEIRSQGFVTLRHDLATLEQMHRLGPAVIIKDNDTVIAYALTMLQECRRLITDLEPMFALMDQLSWDNKPLKSFRFYVMGQVCIAKEYRGRGLFEQLYKHHREIYRSQFDLFVTEISTRNHRSLRAHERIGFKTIHTHKDLLDVWAIVAWDWS